MTQKQQMDDLYRAIVELVRAYNKLAEDWRMHDTECPWSGGSFDTIKDPGDPKGR